MTELSSSPSKASVLYEPEITVDEGAIVASKSTIQYMTAKGEPASDALPKVKLVVKFGTIFHPGSNLVIRLAEIPSEDDIENNNASSKQETVITCIIGKNNLFEETSRLVIDLGAPTCTWQDISKRTRRHEREFDIVGDFNRFAPRSNVQTGSVGSGNSFEAASYIDSVHSSLGRVLDGFVAAPNVRWIGHPLQSLLHKNEEIKEEKSNDDYNHDVLGNKVFFTLNGQVTSRPHQNGKERNIKALEAMLPAMRVVVRRYHKLLENEASK